MKIDDDQRHSNIQSEMKMSRNKIFSDSVEKPEKAQRGVPIERQARIVGKVSSSKLSENDVKWGEYNRQLLQHAGNWDWGLYRNTRFDMAELLKKEGRAKKKDDRLMDALSTYLEVCYFDLNGADNVGSRKDDPELLREYPPFDPTNYGLVAPTVINSIKKIITELDLEIDEVKKEFITHNNKIKRSLKLLPLQTEDCWYKLEKEISK